MRDLGRYPRDHEPSDDPDKEAERLFALRLRKSLSSERFQPDAAAELKDLKAKTQQAEEDADAGRAKARAEALRIEPRGGGA